MTFIVFTEQKTCDMRLCNARFPGDMQANKVHIIGGK